MNCSCTDRTFCFKEDDFEMSMRNKPGFIERGTADMVGGYMKIIGIYNICMLHETRYIVQFGGTHLPEALKSFMQLRKYMVGAA